VFEIWIVWYTDSLGPHEGNTTSFIGLSFTIGMKGWDPGGKLWPTSLTAVQTGGSISSLIASSYFDFFMLPRRVLVLDIV